MSFYTSKPNFLLILLVLTLLNAWITPLSDAAVKPDSIEFAEKKQHNKDAKKGSARQKKALKHARAFFFSQ